ncbi:MAG: hypothetical protein IPP27_14500 [Bacteroidetes bacterium]|nr:hypothetical protein [Bacteroidota bacterium]
MYFNNFTVNNQTNNIPWDSVEYNYGSAFNQGTGLFYCPSTGLYLYTVKLNGLLLLLEVHGLIQKIRQHFSINPAKR